MARFFFHAVDGEFVPGTTGIECATPTIAKAQAVRIAAEMMGRLTSAWK